DIHSDNLIVSDGIPVIVDPECIFYGYSEYVLNDLAGRLLSTGLAAFSPEVSAIRGGDVLVKHFGATENNGEIDYVRLKIVGRRHRLLDSLGCMVNPVKYKRVLCKGFAVAYETLCRRKEKLTAAIENITTPDTKSRILLRLTMHYATVIEMLRKISGENSDIMLGKIIATFLKSGGMSELIDEEVARCEVLDMLEADFPFFWVEDIKGKPFLMHWSGCIACMPQSDALKARIHRATMSCNINQLPVLLKTLRNFLS
ncbi:MAG: DUF4135 domain-containing protein, partial [Microvirgula sp.]